MSKTEKSAKAVGQSRRGFLKTSAVATGAALATGPYVVSAAPETKQTLKAVLIGCGGRGNGAAKNHLEAVDRKDLAEQHPAYPRGEADEALRAHQETLGIMTELDDTRGRADALNSPTQRRDPSRKASSRLARKVSSSAKPTPAAPATPGDKA